MKLNLTVYIILFHFLVSAQKTNSIDKIVGQIGDNIILQSDIESQKLQLIQENKQIDLQSDCSILEDLLFQNLLLNQAELDSIKITDAQVDGEMENRIRVIENQIGGRQKMEEFYGKTIT
ncbi:MAG: hypothetical protein KA264_04290, partial [Crocinitomicaceae bacterium]|nr:hypothetical protein [Crocinitomicaceae bacterium]